ncbi:MAG TPA: iron ABC transporter permease [Acidimicrobiales bacterium]|jgi:iron complex transport system permease protein|nr:iron ABC transporter permease [Acidimicrobiales bacterium]
MLAPVSATIPLLVAGVGLAVVILISAAVGPADVSIATVAQVIWSHVPFVHVHTSVFNQGIVWDIRLPRVVLGGLVGSMLAAGGASYQGVFRNPLADPYLLGVAAGAGLGATVTIVANAGSTALLPVAAFIGGTAAVTLTYFVGARFGGRSSGTSVVLAGVAVAAIFTAAQTFLQQQHAQDLQAVYSWILGSLSGATWSDVWLIMPYVVVSTAVLLAHRRLLDVLRLGEEEATSLGVHPQRVRLVVVVAATLGTAAAVSVSGLIGFVGIIVPHLVRLTTNASYRVVLPVSIVGGAGFLILADLVARTVASPAEVPLGVITAMVGGPFFIFVLRSRRAQRGVL